MRLDVQFGNYAVLDYYVYGNGTACKSALTSCVDYVSAVFAHEYGVDTRVVGIPTVGYCNILSQTEVFEIGMNLEFVVVEILNLCYKLVRYVFALGDYRVLLVYPKLPLSITTLASVSTL